MKKFFEEITSTESILTIAIALTLGMIIGIFFQTQYSIGIRTFFHNIYLKTHPNIQQDSKTQIINRVTKDTPNLPQHSIFEQPQKKDNSIIMVIKKFFIKKEEKPQTINDFILN